ncbi:MAG: diadenylate cyclase [Candidatus Nanoarchaeia archaeon]
MEDNQKPVNKIEEKIFEIGIKIARRGEGAVFILGDNLKNYKFLVPQDVKPFNIVDNPKTVESLALQDGCVWIDQSGILKGYGIAMTRLSPVMNKGTRHASASYASKQGNKVFLVSQEDKKIKIFIKGKIVMEIDALEKGIEKKTNEMVNIFESLGAGTLSVMIMGAASALVPSLSMFAFPILPGITIFTSIYASAKSIRNLPPESNEKNRRIVKIVVGGVVIILGVSIMLFRLIEARLSLLIGIIISIIGFIIAFTGKKRKIE